MKKLFDVIGLENIATQVNDPVVDIMVEKFSNIKRLMRTFRIKNSKQAFNNKRIKKEIEDLDTAISKRFGLPYQHIYDSCGGYAIFTVNQGINNAIAPYREYVMSGIEETVSYCKNSGECGEVKKSKQVKGIDTNADYFTVLTNLLDTTKKIKDTLNTKSIHVDYDKAIVKNFPKDTVIYVMGDLHELLIELDCTPRQLSAVLMHEIGHSFTHISYSYRQIEQTSVLMDTFINNMRKDKSTRESLVLSAKEAYGKDIEGSDIHVFTELTSVIMENINDDNVYGSIDSEQLADQFAVRFGLGGDLAIGLDKLISNSTGGNIFLGLVVTLIQVFLMALLATFNIVMAGIVTIVSIVLGLIAYITTILIVGVDSSARTYDITETRFKRMKFDMIRQLRESGLDKKLIKQTIEDVDKVDRILQTYINTKSVIGSISDVLPWNINKFTYTRAQKELEELSENQLHVGKAKLELLLGEMK